MTPPSTRLGSLVVACVLGLSLTAIGQGPAHAAGTSIHDIDGDGVADLAIGRPGFDNNSGAVELVLSRGTRQLLTASDLGGAAEAEGTFGRSVLVRDFDQDGFADIAIGQPHAAIDEPLFAGRVFVVHGSATGADLNRASSLSLGERNDEYGWSLAALGSPSAPTALVVGAPLSQQADPEMGGAVVVHPITAGTIGAGIVYTQESLGVPGISEDGDEFGYSMDASGQTLIVGAPSESVGSETAAGAVSLLTFSANGRSVTSSKAVSQNTTGIPGTATNHDYFGYSVAAMGNLYAASAPLEDIGTVANTGLVQPFTYTAGGGVSAKPAIHQNVTGVPGVNEKDDLFGRSIDLLRPVAGGRAVIIGTPWENVGSTIDAGTATVVRIDGPAFSAKLIQGGGALPDPADNYVETGMRVQQLTLHAGDVVDRVVVASPGANDFTGVVSVLKSPFTSTERQYYPSVLDSDGGGGGFGATGDDVPNPVK